MNQLLGPILLFLINIFFTFHCESNTPDVVYRRTIRSPDSERIQRWKLAFSGNLAPFHAKQSTVSCNWALKELCLKHVSCRELWTLFRRNCLVDAQNNCLMTNKNDCWQSFEGISWTGLGTCTCPGNNSDCHWIRLQTNYNKCIYLLNHDANWHAELNSPAQFYAINGHHRNHFSRELGVEQWKLEHSNWQRTKQQRSKEEEEERLRKAASEEEEMRRRRIEEEEKERKRKMKEEEERKIKAMEEEQRKIRVKEEEEERKKRVQEERIKRIKMEEERMKSIKAEEERKKKAKAEEEQRRRQIQQADEERKKRRKQEEEAFTAALRKKQREEEDEKRRMENEIMKRRRLLAEEEEEKRKKNNVYYTTVDSDGEMGEIVGRGRPTTTKKNNDEDEGGGGRWTPTTTMASSTQIHQPQQHSAAAAGTTTHWNRVMIRPTAAEQLETQAEKPPTSLPTAGTTKMTTKNGRGKSAEKRPLNMIPQRDDPIQRREPPKIVDEGDGCQTRNIDGEWVEHYPDSVFREFHDWAGRCSSWCECSPTNGTAKCHPLGCLSDVLCEARHTTVVFGQRLYLEDRGACQCHDGRFICDSSELRPQLGPGLYLSLGYSKAELDLIRQKVPKPVLERSGLISQSSSVVKDLATRLQFALERILPEGMQCRVALLENFPPEQVVLMQLQWFGIDPSVNNSRAKWHSGKMEKHCSAYVRELELIFLLEKAPRYQLLLSTIKQIRVIDLLDALPPNSATKVFRIGPINSLFFPFSLLYMITSTHKNVLSPIHLPFILPILVNFILLFRL